MSEAVVHDCTKLNAAAILREEQFHRRQLEKEAQVNIE